MGSRLFLIYSDDTDNGMERLINLFADNTSVPRQITEITFFSLQSKQRSPTIASIQRTMAHKF